MLKYEKCFNEIQKKDIVVVGAGPAGIAAALSVKENVTPRELDAQKIRDALKEKGVEL